jgi:DNA helicase-2/ATP-dependent DNA helicase PcrA
LLIIAGPGSGKTRTVIHRIAWLLTYGLARPREILAVTFSVRAAGELRLRLADLLREQVAAAVTAATFHSVCARMLRDDAALFGRTEDYTIYDQADLRHVIEWLLSNSKRGAIQAVVDAYGEPASSEVLSEISLAKNRLCSPVMYERSTRHPAAPVIAEVWREAEKELCRSNAFSFDGLLVEAVRLLAEHPDRLAHCRQRWKWVLVDEFQDTNEAQGVLIALLVGPDGNVCAVADDDQLIHSFRVAEPRNVLAFAERFPGHAQIVLGRNFRSRSEILNPRAVRSMTAQPDDDTTSRPRRTRVGGRRVPDRQGCGGASACPSADCQGVDRARRSARDQDWAKGASRAGGLSADAGARPDLSAHSFGEPSSGLRLGGRCCCLPASSQLGSRGGRSA